MDDTNGKLRVLITGVTGMVGEGVMHECLNHPDVGRVVTLGRRACGVVHPKLEEIVHADLYDITPIEARLAGLNACFFCLGTSSIGKSEAEYTKISHTLTLHIAARFRRLNPQATFAYVSGKGTDSTEKGRVMWARVKGRTENDLAKLGFRAAFAYRPGYMHPTPGLVRVNKYYKYVTWLYPILRAASPNHVNTLREVGLAMIETALHEPGNKVVEVADIRAYAKRNSERTGKPA